MHGKAGIVHQVYFVKYLLGQKSFPIFPNKQPNIPMAPSPQEAADAPVAAVVAQKNTSHHTSHLLKL